MFGQFLCCMSRVKTVDVDKSTSGQGIFPFEEASSTRFETGDTQSENVFICMSKSGTKLGWVTPDRARIFECSVGTDATEDRCSVIRDFKLTSTDVVRHAQVVEGSSPGSTYLVILNLRAITILDVATDVRSDVASPPDSGDITCGCQANNKLPDNPVVAAGTSAGDILLYNIKGELARKFKVSGAVSCIGSDNYYIYVGIGNRVEIFSMMSVTPTKVDVLELPQDPFGQVGSSILRPVVRLIDRRPSSPVLSPEKGPKPVGSLFVVNKDKNCLAHVNLELRQIVTESIIMDSIEQLVFGPFDNGPVISASHRCMAAWESGAFLRMSSKLKKSIVSIAVSQSREKPRIWALSKHDNGQWELSSLALRSGSYGSPKSARVGCL